MTQTDNQTEITIQVKIVRKTNNRFQAYIKFEDKVNNVLRYDPVDNLSDYIKRVSPFPIEVTEQVVKQEKVSGKSGKAYTNINKRLVIMGIGANKAFHVELPSYRTTVKTRNRQTLRANLQHVHNILDKTK